MAKQTNKNQGDGKRPRCPIHGAVMVADQERRGSWWCYPCACCGHGHQVDDCPHCPKPEWPATVYDHLDPRDVRASGCEPSPKPLLKRLGLALRIARG